LHFVDIKYLVDTFGSAIVLVTALMIFLESSTVFGAFLPGDSLLFTVGLTLATSASYPLMLASSLLVYFASVAGSQTGYLFGRKVGPLLFRNRKSRFLSEKTLHKAEAFFEEYGSRAIVFSRFVPVLRALVPTLAGTASFESRRFLRMNLIGGFAWVVVLMHAGYLLGLIPSVHANIQNWIIGYAIVSSLPMPFEVGREWLKQRAEKRKAAL
jgi:membrane-associated protein